MIGKKKTEEAPKPYKNKDKNDEFYEWRNKFLAKTPEEKARENSWGHFNLFYYLVYRKDIREEMKKHYGEQHEIAQNLLQTEIRRIAANFFRENPYRDTPAISLWQKFLNLPSDTKLYKGEILGRQESRDVEDSKKTEVYMQSYQFQLG